MLREVARYPTEAEAKACIRGIEFMNDPKVHDPEIRREGAMYVVLVDDDDWIEDGVNPEEFDGEPPDPIDDDDDIDKLEEDE